MYLLLLCLHCADLGAYFVMLICLVKISRFFRYMFLLFSIHQMALGLFRSMAAISRDMVISNTFGSASLLVIFLMGGFIMPKGNLQFSPNYIHITITDTVATKRILSLPFFLFFFSGMIKPWWIWAFWVSPLSYGQRAISVNEFTATRWNEVRSLCHQKTGSTIHKKGITNRLIVYFSLLLWMLLQTTTFGNVTLGNSLLHSHSLPVSDNWYWLGVGVLLIYALFFNIIVTLALTFLNRK